MEPQATTSYNTGMCRVQGELTRRSSQSSPPSSTARLDIVMLLNGHIISSLVPPQFTPDGFKMPATFQMVLRGEGELESKKEDTEEGKWLQTTGEKLSQPNPRTGNELYDFKILIVRCGSSRRGLPPAQASIRTPERRVATHDQGTGRKETKVRLKSVRELAYLYLGISWNRAWVIVFIVCTVSTGLDC